jgi:hypothetical protein
MAYSAGERAMRYTDIAIVGGGLAGSTAAAMLGRAGISTALIDPHEAYPPDFRVEKISGPAQVDTLWRTGFAESVLRRATFVGENWIARFGRLLDKAPSRQFGFDYHDFVNAIRAEIPDTVERICAKAVSISTSPERQQVNLSSDEAVSARLVVLANGLNVGLRHQLGIAREITSRCHSISAGFDVVPVGRSAFDFPALTYFSERPGDRIPTSRCFRSAAGCAPICSSTAPSTIRGCASCGRLRLQRSPPHCRGCLGSPAGSRSLARSRSGPSTSTRTAPAASRASC